MFSLTKPFLFAKHFTVFIYVWGEKVDNDNVINENKYMPL